jgi:hypothetical protein
MKADQSKYFNEKHELPSIETKKGNYSFLIKIEIITSSLIIKDNNLCSGNNKKTNNIQNELHKMRQNKKKKCFLSKTIKKNGLT